MKLDYQIWNLAMHVVRKVQKTKKKNRFPALSMQANYILLLHRASNGQF